jgi:CheY-like chemotaxis protein
VKGAADHLLSLINDVLDLAKIEAGRVELKPERFCVGEALDEVLPGLRASAVQRGLKFEQRGDECLVYADRLRFKQMIYNLVSNAIKFTREGGVRISASQGDGETRIQVADTGIGITPEAQGSIFDAFYQAGGTTPIQEGAGLGLAITRRLVEQHGGSIRVESAPGQGSRFQFSLPLPAVAAPQPPVDESGETGLPMPPATEPAHALRVAVVEDNASSRRLLEVMLSPPFSVNSYADAASALDQIPRSSPDVILLDIALPGMNGVDLLKALRTHPELQQVPIASISAQAMSGDRDKFLAAGFDAYFAKPITSAGEFQTAIRRMAESAKTSRSTAALPTSRSAVRS